MVCIFGEEDDALLSEADLVKSALVVCLHLTVPCNIQRSSYGPTIKANTSSYRSHLFNNLNETRIAI